jgi:hypothetical protein
LNCYNPQKTRYRIFPQIVPRRVLIGLDMNLGPEARCSDWRVREISNIYNFLQSVIKKVEFISSQKLQYFQAVKRLAMGLVTDVLFMESTGNFPSITFRSALGIIKPPIRRLHEVKRPQRVPRYRHQYSF